MLRPKKVAIIGAGPSGLVAAKTLLHNYPKGTFSPTIFEKCRAVGGLWPTGDSPSSSPNSPSPTSSPGNLGRRGRGLIDPRMRTNLSRFTVGFSDFAWESVLGGGGGGTEKLPMFPQAWQVGKYLECYAERYLPEGALRLGCRVVRTVREMPGGRRARWVVQWVCERESDEMHSEEFDYLLVASGYFSNPHVPNIPGLSMLAEKTAHSSAVHTEEDMRQLLERSGSNGGKVVVIGGSMSGVETASALAMHLSSMDFTPGVASQAGKAYEVHHVCSRPFWAVPYYLPHETPRGDGHSGRVQFLPLDLVFYDLSRRPPGPVEYGFGPVSSQQVTKTNQYFRSLLGNDCKDVGEKMLTLENGSSHAVQPSWIGIGDDYAEFVRSKFIHPAVGRVSEVHVSETGKARIDIQLAGGGMTSLDDVAAIVTATGFTPFPSLDFLPADVLAALDYSADAFFPVVLDGKGSTNALVPDIGFVGFYRGPYWGVMEMQARNIAESWFRSERTPELSAEEIEQKTEERQKVREFRSVGSAMQFPMGDYVGLMESFARDVRLSRSSLDGEWPGPVIPARYTVENEGCEQEASRKREVQTTIDSLHETLFPIPGSSSLAMASATFRALHGAWRFSKAVVNGTGRLTGTATFHPRYPSSQGYEKEYICEQHLEGQNQTLTSVYRLAAEGINPHICVWDVDYDPNSASRFSHGFCIAPGQLEDSGKVIVHASADTANGCRYEYAFQFEGVTISSWECTLINGVPTKTVYTRR